MTDQIISFQTAKLAKEKGFDWGVFEYFNLDNVFTKEKQAINDGYICNINYNDRYTQPNAFSAPTQTLLQKWLREKHNIHIEVQKHPSGYLGYLKAHYTITGNKIIKTKLFSIYEEALESGLLKALKEIK